MLDSYLSPALNPEELAGALDAALHRSDDVEAAHPETALDRFVRWVSCDACHGFFATDDAPEDNPFLPPEEVPLSQ